MVISFSDSMQLTFAARERLIAGEDRRAAFRNAVWIVGPACVLTHATAALSFAALQFSDSDLIKAFGEAGLIAIDHRALHRLDSGAGARRLARSPRSGLRDKNARSGYRRRRLAPILRLGRAENGRPTRSLQPRQRHCGGGSWRSTTSTCSRAIDSPIRCRTSSKRSRRIISSTSSSKAPIRSMCSSRFRRTHRSMRRSRSP